MFPIFTQTFLEFPKLLNGDSINTANKVIPNPVKMRHINIGTWNVQRGLLKREKEITDLLISEELDVMFLTETDAKKENIQGYKIKGYDTHLQSVITDGDLVRIDQIRLE